MFFNNTPHHKTLKNNRNQTQRDNLLYLIKLQNFKRYSLIADAFFHCKLSRLNPRETNAQPLFLAPKKGTPYLF